MATSGIGAAQCGRGPLRASRPDHRREHVHVRKTSRRRSARAGLLTRPSRGGMITALDSSPALRPGLLRRRAVLASAAAHRLIA
jgi:hypothetical protein